MKRWHDDFKAVNKTWHTHHESHVESNKDSVIGRVGVSAYEVDCVCDVQKGRFRKINPFCNKRRCHICKSHKSPKRELTLEEIKSNFDFQEQLSDLAA